MTHENSGFAYCPSCEGTDINLNPNGETRCRVCSLGCQSLAQWNALPRRDKPFEQWMTYAAGFHPEEGASYMVSYTAPQGKRWVGHDLFLNGEWYSRVNYARAWMELPQPYGGR